MKEIGKWKNNHVTWIDQFVYSLLSHLCMRCKFVTLVKGSIIHSFKSWKQFNGSAVIWLCCFPPSIKANLVNIISKEPWSKMHVGYSNWKKKIGLSGLKYCILNGFEGCSFFAYFVILLPLGGDNAIRQNKGVFMARSSRSQQVLRCSFHCWLFGCARLHFST